VVRSDSKNGRFGWYALIHYGALLKFKSCFLGLGGMGLRFLLVFSMGGC
jgi:hypothetical protein